MIAVVGVILGSKSDLPFMESCVKVLEELGLQHEVKVCSAHRNPRGVMEWATSARERGIKVVIAAAGGAAHHQGRVAAGTDLPVLGGPAPTHPPRGVARLYSPVQLPAGSTAATVVPDGDAAVPGRRQAARPTPRWPPQVPWPSWVAGHAPKSSSAPLAAGRLT